MGGEELLRHYYLSIYIHVFREDFNLFSFQTFMAQLCAVGWSPSVSHSNLLREHTDASFGERRESTSLSPLRFPNSPGEPEGRGALPVAHNLASLTLGFHPSAGCMLFLKSQLEPCPVTTRTVQDLQQRSLLLIKKVSVEIHFVPKRWIHAERSYQIMYLIRYKVSSLSGAVVSQQKSCKQQHD